MTDCDNITIDGWEYGGDAPSSRHEKTFVLLKLSAKPSKEWTKAFGDICGQELGDEEEEWTNLGFAPYPHIAINATMDWLDQNRDKLKEIVRHSYDRCLELVKARDADKKDLDDLEEELSFD